MPWGVPHIVLQTKHSYDMYVVSSTIAGLYFAGGQLPVNADRQVSCRVQEISRSNAHDEVACPAVVTQHSNATRVHDKTEILF